MSQEIIAGNGSGILRARRWRRSPGLATAIGVTVALVMTGCGGRATDHEGAAAPAKGNAAASAQPAAASPDQSTPQPSTAPAADPGSGAAPVATPAASPQAATPGAAANPAAASNTATAAPAKGPGTATAAGTRQAAGGTTPAPNNPGAVPAPPVPGPPGGGGPHTGPATLSPVNVGSICECSGPAGASVGPGIASNQLVVKWINDNGGLNGHPIKLFVADSNSDPNRYFSLVKQMVESDKVIAFMGQMAPLTVNAADKYLRDKQIPVVGGDGAHGLWFQSPVLFFPGPSYTTQAVGTAKLAVALNTPKVAMFYCAEAQPCQVGRDALHSKLKDEKAPDAQIVYEAKVSLAQPDFSAECLQAKSKGAQAVIVFVDAAAASRATRVLYPAGFPAPVAHESADLGPLRRPQQRRDGQSGRRLPLVRRRRRRPSACSTRWSGATTRASRSMPRRPWSGSPGRCCWPARRNLSGRQPDRRRPHERDVRPSRTPPSTGCCPTR